MRGFVKNVVRKRELGELVFFGKRQPVRFADRGKIDHISLAEVRVRVFDMDAVLQFGGPELFGRFSVNRSRQAEARQIVRQLALP